MNHIGHNILFVFKWVSLGAKSSQNGNKSVAIEFYVTFREGDFGQFPIDVIEFVRKFGILTKIMPWS